jgi:hypothetical protein
MANQGAKKRKKENEKHVKFLALLVVLANVSISDPCDFARFLALQFSFHVDCVLFCRISCLPTF